MNDMKNKMECSESLEKLFHEPKRLLIMSQLCASYHPLTFNELKELCDTSDGNLHRHLKVLEDNGMVEARKSFVDRKPLTTIALSAKGVERFERYINNLENVLVAARKSMHRKKEQFSLTAGDELLA